MSKVARRTTSTRRIPNHHERIVPLLHCPALEVALPVAGRSTQAPPRLQRERMSSSDIQFRFPWDSLNDALPSERTHIVCGNLQPSDDGWAEHSATPVADSWNNDA